MALAYSQKPIAELMDELEQLGGSSQVRMNTMALYAVTGGCSKIIDSRTHSEDDSKQAFVAVKGYRKKYYYNQLHDSLSTALLSEPLVQFYSGFNVNVVLVGIGAQEVLRLLPRHDQMAVSYTSYSLTGEKVVDLIRGQVLQSRSEEEFYSYDGNNIKFESQPQNITVARFLSPSKTSSQFRLITFPAQMIKAANNPTRSQLGQIVEYIRNNRDKFSKENINKLFIKKSRAVSMLIDTIFDNSLNWIVNQLSDQEQQLEAILEYVNRFKGLPSFARRTQPTEYKVSLYEAPEQEIRRPPQPKQTSRESAHSRSKEHYQSSTILIEQQEPAKSKHHLLKEDFEYCRSLQRKTHKYSVSPSAVPHSIQSLQEDVADAHLKGLPAKQKISILKAQHMIEISKYHQTIQSLNAKMLSLAKERGLEDLCGEYQREIMQLELKIDEMRQQLLLMSHGDDISLKKVVRKLTEEVATYQKNRTSAVHSQSRELSNVYRASVEQFKQKLQESEKNRQLLSDELRQLAKRLEIREQQISQLNKKLEQYHQPRQQLIEKPTLNIKTEKQYMQMVALLQELNQGNGLSYVFIRKKLSGLFETLSISKKALVECQTFLVDLQTLLEGKLSSSHPTIVLDCNRFIRSFMLKALEIQE